MERAAAIQQIRDASRDIARQMMKIHPAIPHLGNPETQGEILKALHQLTVELEVVKKKVGRLERDDDSTLL